MWEDVILFPSPSTHTWVYAGALPFAWLTPAPASGLGKAFSMRKCFLTHPSSFPALPSGWARVRWAKMGDMLGSQWTLKRMNECMHAWTNEINSLKHTLKNSVKFQSKLHLLQEGKPTKMALALQVRTLSLWLISGYMRALSRKPLANSESTSLRVYFEVYEVRRCKHKAMWPIFLSGLGKLQFSDPKPALNLHKAFES